MGQVDAVLHAVDLYLAETEPLGAPLCFLQIAGEDICRESGIRLVGALQNVHFVGKAQQTDHGAEDFFLIDTHRRRYVLQDCRRIEVSLIQTVGPDGKFVRGFGQIGDRTGQFARPKGLGIDRDGNLYVADAAHGNFQIFNADGQLLMFIGGRAYEPGPANYMLTAGLAVDEDGRIYVVDQYFRKIDVFRPAALAADEGFLGARAQ